MIVTAGHLVGGRYRLIEPIGRGGMATVWHGYDETLGREVAVKQIVMSRHASDEDRRKLVDRVMREARNAARLSDHPNIVAVHDVVREDGVPWTIMQLVIGRSLEQYLDASGPLPTERVAEVAAAMLKALGAAHAAGIVHRDVKPGNVMLADNGEILLTDFGIAVHQADIGLTTTGMLVGSPGYVAPERLRGAEANGAADLFSLGVTLYRAVEGVPPFPEGIPLAVFDDPTPPQRAGALAPLVMGLLEKEPGRRPGVPEALAMIGPPVREAKAAPATSPAGAQDLGAEDFGAGLISAGSDGAGAEPAQVDQNPEIPWQVSTDPADLTATEESAAPGAPGGRGAPRSPNRRKKTSKMPVAVPVIGLVILVVIAVAAFVVYHGDQKPSTNAGAPARRPSAGTAPKASAQITPTGSASPSPSPSASPAAAQPTAGEITGYQNLCLDDRSGGGGAGTEVIAYTCHGGGNQTWTLESNGTIQTNESCLDVGSTSTGAHMAVLDPCNPATASEDWQLKPNGELVDAQSGQCLADAVDGASGTWLLVQTCNDGPTQRWGVLAGSASPSPSSAAAQPVAGEITGFQQLCMDDNSGGTGPGNPVQAYPCDGGPNQLWTLEPNDTVQVMGGCLDVGSGAAGAQPAVLDPCDGAATESWLHKPNGELVDQHSGLCLTDPGDSTSGVQLQTETCNGGADQLWSAQ